MGNVVSIAKAHNVEIKAPSEPPKAPEEGDALKYEPSEALLSLWESIAPGCLNDYIALYINKPYTLTTFDDEVNESFKGYKRLELVKGCTGYNVLTIWDCTDGHINVYELVDGEYKGQLVAFSYGDIKVYLGKTMKELIEVAESLEWKDEDKDMEDLFKGVFGEFQ